MNCQPRSLSIMTRSKTVPTGSGELTPDKPIKRGERWNKTSGLEDDGGTVDEAGTSNPSGMRRCQSAGTHLWSSRIYPPQQGCWPSSSRLRGFPYGGLVDLFAEWLLPRVYAIALEDHVRVIVGRMASNLVCGVPLYVVLFLELLLDPQEEFIPVHSRFSASEELVEPPHALAHGY